MPVQFNIKITKEILRLSKYCGTASGVETIEKHCAIALSLKDIFPEVFVTGDCIYPFGKQESCHSNQFKLPLPKVAQDFIKVFDSLSMIPNARLCLPEFNFDISVSDEVISEINIDEIRDLAFVSCAVT